VRAYAVLQSIVLTRPFRVHPKNKVTLFTIGKRGFIARSHENDVRTDKMGLNINTFNLIK